jgi:anti-anti-sigma regulatory factor
MTELATIEEVRTTQGSTRVERPKAMTMALEGALAENDLALVGEMLLQVALEGVTDVVIDFHQVSHLDYRGLSLLQRQAEVFRRAGGDLKMAGLSTYLFTIFQAAGAAFDFDFFPDVSTAQRSFLGSAATLDA